MITRIRNVYILILIAGALLFGALFARVHTGRVLEESTITTPRGEIWVTLAQDQASWEQGLSGTKSLEANTGKLFIFDKPDTYGFWMKDMRYPLDIVWIDETQTIIAVTADAIPESYPEVFYPPKPVLYVLELNAGEAAVEMLSPGTQINIVRSR